MGHTWLLALVLLQPHAALAAAGQAARLRPVPVVLHRGLDLHMQVCYEEASLKGRSRKVPLIGLPSQAAAQGWLIVCASARELHAW